MSFQAGAVVGQMSMENKPTITAVDEAIAEMKKFKTEGEASMGAVQAAMKKTGEVAEGGLRGQLEKLKAGAGRRSILGESAELLAGGGVVMGLSMAGDAAKEFAENISKMKEEFQQADTTAGDMIETIAGGIPVFGKFWQAGRQIRDIFTGELDELNEMQQQVKEQNDAFQRRAEIIKESTKAQLEFNETFARMKEARGIFEMPEGQAKKIAQVNADMNKQIDDTYHQYQTTGQPDRVADLQKQLADAKSAQAAAQQAATEAHNASARGPSWTDTLLNASGPAGAAYVSSSNKNGVNAADNELDKAAKHTQNVLTELQAAQKADNDARTRYWEARGEIEHMGADKIKAIIDGEAKATAEARQKEVDDAAKQLAALRAAVMNPIDSVNLANQQFGMSETQKLLDNLKRAKDDSGHAIISNEELDKAKAVLDKADALSKSKEMDDKIKAFRDSIETPAQKFKEIVDQLSQWKRLGKEHGGIDPDEYNIGVANARKSLFGEDKLPELIKSGSAESLAATFDGKQKMQRDKDASRQLLDEAKKQTPILQSISDNLGAPEIIQDIAAA